LAPDQTVRRLKEKNGGGGAGVEKEVGPRGARKVMGKKSN